MAVTPTILQDAVVIVQERFGNKKFEKRQQVRGAFDCFRDNTDLALPASILERAKKAASHVVKIPQLNKRTFAIGTSRDCEPTATAGTSAFQTLTWATIKTTVQLNRAQAANNYITAEEQLANDLYFAFVSLYDNLETKAVTAIDANKSAVNATTFTYDGYGVTSGVWTAAKANWKPSGLNIADSNYYATLPQMMAENKQDGALQIVTNYGAIPARDIQSNQGDANAVNSAWMFNGMQFYKTPSISNGVGVASTQYVLQAGDLAFLSWLPMDFQMGSRLNESNYWSVMSDESLGFKGLEWGVRYLGRCEDLSATYSGLTSTKTETWEISMDVAYVVSYSSDTSSPIKKVELLTT